MTLQVKYEDGSEEYVDSHHLATTLAPGLESRPKATVYDHDGNKLGDMVLFVLTQLTSCEACAHAARENDPETTELMDEYYRGAALADDKESRRARRDRRAK